MLSYLMHFVPNKIIIIVIFSVGSSFRIIYSCKHIPIPTNVGNNTVLCKSGPKVNNEI